MTQGSIRIRGARQHNLQNLDLDIRLYRHAASRNRKVDDLWRIAKNLLEREPA